MKRTAHWNLKSYNEAEAERLAGLLQVSPVIIGILLNRGITEEAAIREFLFGRKEPYHDPFLLKGMEEAVTRILRAVAAGETITVFGDYDVDGITATSLLYLYLLEAGAAVQTYIPRRQGEGYGLNSEALQALYEAGSTLIITVDCGISGVQEVAEAPEGLDIIITDHHRPGEVLPAASAVINPKQPGCAYPFKGLSGVGVAFKLCQALHQRQEPSCPLWGKYTELVALGTVADIVPLLDENRELVRRGLAAMQQTGLIGLKKLLEVCRCDRDPLNTEKIGFILAPRLNAVGRLEHAQLAVELLTATDAAKAAGIAQTLNEENTARQEISRRIFEEAEQMLAKEGPPGHAIVLAKEGWHAGVIGIVASRLVDKYYRPVILLSINGEQAKGSCRSIPPLDMYDALTACSDELIQFGGHSQAAGLTLETAGVEVFRQHFIHIVEEKLKPEDYEPSLSVDVALREQDALTLPFVHELERLEPFGCENPPPLFMLQGTVLHNPRAVGKEQTHLRFFADVGRTSCHCIMWQGAEYLDCLYNNVKADIAFRPRVNVYNGTENLNLETLMFRMELELYDRRQADDKEEELHRLLERGETRWTVFLESGSRLRQQLSLSPKVRLRYYGELCEPDETNLIFYDLPEKDIFQPGRFPVAEGSSVILYLLYNYGDLAAAGKEDEKHYPDRDHLASVYRFIHRLLLEQGAVSREELWQQAAVKKMGLTENDLKIFSELDFFHLQGNLLQMGNMQRRKLDESPLYRLLQEGKKQRDEIRKNNLRRPRTYIQELRYRCGHRKTEPVRETLSSGGQKQLSSGKEGINDYAL